MIRKVLLSLALVATVTSLVMAEADLKSGPPVGATLGAYQVTKIAGPSNGVPLGQQLCYR